MDSITISGVTMSIGAARNVEATSTDVAADVARIRGGLSREDLLAECLDGVDDETTAADWRAYVEAVVCAPAALPATYQQIGKLREEAFTHGDEVMGQICNLAMDIGVVYDSLSERDSDRLRGMTQEQAIAECDRVIRDAAAQS